MIDDEPRTDPAPSDPGEPLGWSAAETLARALGTAVPSTPQTPSDPPVADDASR